jgi:hypothetical protein
MFIVSLILLGASLIPTIYAYWCFDRALLLEYQDHNESWVQDGKPNGLFWYPQESLIDGDHYYRTNKMYYVLLLSTPSWVAKDDKVNRYVKHYRLFSMIGMIIFFSGFIVFMKYK